MWSSGGYLGGHISAGTSRRLRLLGEPRREERELGVYRLEIAERVVRRRVDHVDEDATPLDVAQEGAAQTCHVAARTLSLPRGGPDAVMAALASHDGAG